MRPLLALLALAAVLTLGGCILLYDPYTGEIDRVVWLHFRHDDPPASQDGGARP